MGPVIIVRSVYASGTLRCAPNQVCSEFRLYEYSVTELTAHVTQEPQAAYTAQRHEHYVTLHVSDELDAAHGAASCALQ